MTRIQEEDYLKISMVGTLGLESMSNCIFYDICNSDRIVFVSYTTLREKGYSYCSESLGIDGQCLGSARRGLSGLGPRPGPSSLYQM